MWYEEDSNDPQMGVQLIVTGWRQGTGPARFADVVENTGACRWTDPVSPASAGDLPGDQAWAGVEDSSLNRSFAAARLGDLIVAVTVDDNSEGAEPTLAVAKDLLIIAEGRLASAGLAAAAG